MKKKYAIELEPETQCGKGLRIVHYGGIKINPAVRMGDNITLFGGCCIGSIRGGKRKGAPTLGNDVWIGVNAVVCGGITIGNHVVIAPNAFVNFDVPDNSVCVGSPAMVRHKENATRYYTYNKIDTKE